MNNDLLGSAIDKAYLNLESFPENGRSFARRVALEYDETLRVSADLIKQDPDALLKQWSQATLVSYFELAALLILATDSRDQELTRFKDLAHQLDRILQSNEPQKARAGARALLESLILVIEDVHEETTQQILELLARLSNAPEGVIPLSAQVGEQGEAKVGSDDQAVLRSLLQVGLYREVMIFLRQREEVNRARESAEFLKHIIKPAVSLMSRKGGVGKSMLAFATAAWFVKYVQPEAKVCIIDLDLSGPVWQYLLFPERDRPSHFLNDLLRLEQGNQKGDFEFPDVTTELIEPFLEESTIDVLGTHLRLLSFADLPRTSRFLSLAVANNSESCFKFLIQLLSALQSLVDLVVIDNGPGFESLPLLSHVLASSVPHGCSVVISTPALPDLRGTLIELSDLNVLDRDSAMVKEPPVWVVNKADKKAQEFMAAEHKIVDVAYEIGAYNKILPKRPMIARSLSAAGSQFRGLALPLDPALLAFGNIKNSGTAPLKDALTTFLGTEFFKCFVERIGPKMLPLLMDDPVQERIVNTKP
jgi:cellulose biosynthesis protein BcsQ